MTDPAITPHETGLTPSPACGKEDSDARTLTSARPGFAADTATRFTGSHVPADFTRPDEGSASRRVWWGHRVRAAVDVKGAARAVLYALADRAQDDGVAWPGQEQLALDSGVSDRTVRDVLRALVASGHVEHAGSKFGADLWRLTLDEAGQPFGNRILPVKRKLLPAEATSGDTGTYFRGDRKLLPERPEATSDKGIRKVSEKDEGKGSAPTGGRAPGHTNPEATTHRNAPASVTATPEATADLDATADAIDRLDAAWASAWPHRNLDDRRHLLTMLDRVEGDSLVERARAVAEIVAFVASAPDARGRWGTLATFLREQRHGALRTAASPQNRFERLRSLQSAAREWHVLGCPTTVDALRAAPTPSVDPADTAWRDMFPRLKGARDGARNEHNPRGIVLADDPDEHERRRLAWREACPHEGVKRWSLTENDFQRRDIERAWREAYRSMRAGVAA